MNRKIEILLVAVLATLTIAVSAYFAPIGSNGGFVDMSHDGYTLREALDLDRGATIFKDTYEQYGTLGPYLNLAAFRLFGRRLLGVKYAICLWYGLIAVLLYLGARHFLGPTLSVMAGVIWLALAPFYQHGIMISVHVYVLAAQAAAMLALFAYVDRPSRARLAMAGLFCGFSCVLKQSVGFLFAVAVTTYLATRVVRGRSTLGHAIRDLLAFGVAIALVIAASLSFLWASGAFHDWYLQTILFPRQFYLVVGDGTGFSPALWTFPLRFFQAHIRENVAYYWYVIRAILAIALVTALWKGARDVREEKLVLVGLLSLVLWLAAYPSPHYMHQWWTLSLGIAALVYCLQKTSEWYLAYSHYEPRFVRALTFVFGFVIAGPGVLERLVDGARRAFAQQETITEPWVISGFKVDLESRNDLTLLESTIDRFVQKHPGTRLVSVDSSDGWRHGVAESLLWLSLLDDNTHPHPIYWSMPVLASETYPDYQRRLTDYLRQARPLVGEARVGQFSPQYVDGYYLLLAIHTARGYWYLYAPDYPEAHGVRERTILVRLPDATTKRRRRQAAGPDSSTFIPASFEGNAAEIRRENRDVYLWPDDVDLPDVVPQTLQPITGPLHSYETAMQVGASGWHLDADVRSPYTYLLGTEAVERNEGQYFVARGNVSRGGVTFGFQQGEQWIAYVNVTKPGPFLVLLRVPKNGSYNVIVANCVPDPWSVRLRHPLLWMQGALLRNHFDVTSVGWSTGWD